MSIFSWLKSIGLCQYAEVFEEQGIEIELIGELTNDDLKELGVTKMGDRKKILIAARTPAQSSDSGKSENASAVENVETAEYKNLATTGSGHQVATDAENRLLTVMFCDLVGSTELSTQVDTEELREIINRFQATCSTVIQESGGFIARYMGDGILVYFGYPAAGEDDAERAVLCGLNLLKEMPAIDGKLRVGIATGRVIVGDLLGAGPAQERTVVGETPNLAARLQALADENTVVISNTTRSITGNAFEFQHLGEHTLKGFSDPVSAWQVLGEKSGSSRFEARSDSAQSELIGRDSELLLLKTRWRAALKSEGQVIFVSGEAGIGKSRLTDALRKDVVNAQTFSIEYQCAPHHSNSALYPVIRQFQFAAGIGQLDSNEEQLDKLERLLAATPGKPLADEGALFARMLSIKYEQRYGPLPQPPDQIKALTTEALVNQLTRLATEKPVLFLIEDAHWIDPTTLAVLDITIQRLEDTRILMVVTHRPEWQPSYSGVTVLQLNRLGKSNSADLIRNIIGKYATDSLIQRLVARTDGIPLFIEELSKSLAENALELDDADIPETLQASLLARIDRLDLISRDIAQLAASIGREFDKNLLLQSSDSTESEIDNSLQSLLTSELIVRVGAVVENRYLFKHALIQEAVYGTMLRQVRRDRHRRIAIALADNYSSDNGAQAQILARHYHEAGNTIEAADCWQAAGLHYASLSSNVEAVEQFRSALNALNALPDSVNNDSRKLKLAISMTGPLVASDGFTGSKTAEHVAYSLDLALNTGETREIFPILYGRYIPHCLGGKLRAACELADEFTELAKKEELPAFYQNGLRIKGQSNLLAGNTETALSSLRNASAIELDQNEILPPYLFGQDIQTGAMVYMSWALGYTAQYDECVQLMETAVKRSRTLDHPNTTGYAYIHAALLYVWLGLNDRLEEIVTEWKTLDSQHQVPVWRPFFLLVDISNHCKQGRHEEAINTYISIQSNYIEKTKLKAFMQEPYARAAEAYMNLQRFEEAFDVIKEAEMHADVTGENFFHCEVLRIKAKLLAASNSPYPEVIAAMESAKQSCEQTNAKLVLLRLAMDDIHYRQKQSSGPLTTELLRSCLGDLKNPDAIPEIQSAWVLFNELT